VNALVISDLHAHDSWPFSRPLPNGLPSRFQDLLNVCDQVVQILDQGKYTDLFILGDLLHRRHFVRFSLLNPLYDAIFRMARRVKKVVMIPGNHDFETHDVHSLHIFGQLPGVDVVNKPMVTRLSNGEEVFMLPWSNDPHIQVHAVEHAPSLPFFGHYGAEGCPLETDYWLEAPIKVGELARFPLTVFGHIHKPGVQLDGKIQYVGAPMHFDFGDHGDRGVLSVRGHGGGIRVERINLVSPKMITARHPRIPLPPNPGGGYLRLMEVPPNTLVEAREEALRLGWLDCIPIAKQMPDALRDELEAAHLAGAAVDRPMIERYVARLQLDEKESKAMVEEGVAILEASRS